MQTRLDTLEQLAPFATAGELLARTGRSLVSISPDAGAGEAARLMQQEDIGFLVVLEGGTLAGVVSERDLVRGVHIQRPTFVREIMKTRIHAVAPDAKVPECLALMHRERIRHLPVVTGDAVHGVLSVRDLMGSLIEHHERVLRKLRDERVTLLNPYSSSY